MPNYTPNLNLAKPLGGEAYDISVPNGNMDIIDSAIKQLSDNQQVASEAEAKAGTDNTKIMTPLAANYVTGKLTSLTTTNKTSLVAAINEVKLQANDIKTKWATVIGAPLSPSDTQAQLESKTQIIKNTMAVNLTNKGAPALGTETLTSLANKISNVQTGASGTFNLINISGGGGITITGLGFLPRFILVEGNFTAVIARKTYIQNSTTGLNNLTYFSNNINNDFGAWTVSSGGFSTRITGNTLQVGQLVNWYAFP